MLPALTVLDAPATADYHATRIVYPRPVIDEFDSVYASHLEISEWQGDSSWDESRLVAGDGWGNYNRYPKLTPDGLYLAFDGGVSFKPDYVPYALWEMGTNDSPAAAPPLFIDGFDSGTTSAWISVQ